MPGLSLYARYRRSLPHTSPAARTLIEQAKLRVLAKTRLDILAGVNLPRHFENLTFIKARPDTHAPCAVCAAPPAAPCYQFCTNTQSVQVTVDCITRKKNGAAEPICGLYLNGRRCGMNRLCLKLEAIGIP